ncbi:hypothetical protein SAMN05216316_0781 [Nitrosovibrio sp. Nv6]|nr:hypothetical protein SAMN05216316_0781 [Nitrosovibrio sp. Nv6]
MFNGMMATALCVLNAIKYTIAPILQRGIRSSIVHRPIESLNGAYRITQNHGAALPWRLCAHPSSIRSGNRSAAWKITLSAPDYPNLYIARPDACLSRANASRGVSDMIKMGITRLENRKAHPVEDIFLVCRDTRACCYEAARCISRTSALTKLSAILELTVRYKNPPPGLTNLNCWRSPARPPAA